MMTLRPETVEPRSLVTPTRGVLLFLAAALFCTAAEAGTLTLAWDPSPDPSVSGYRVYVGTSPRVYRQTFDVAGQSSFVFTQAVAGTRYYFAVASVTAGGKIGPPSPEISDVASDEVTLGSPERVQDAASRGDGARSAERVCAGNAGPCYSVRHLATNLGIISALTATPDGRLLFIEDGQHIRVLAPGRPAESALAVNPATTTFVGIALDPAFAVNGYVYVGELESGGRDGGVSQAIARYRLLNNVLGERLQVTTVATGASKPAAPFALGADRRLYVAVSADSEYALSENGMPGGAILRFTLDGTVPPDNWRSSPLFATSVASPHAIAIDPRGQRLWVGGAGAAPAIASVDLGAASVASLRRAARASLRAAANDSGPVLVAAAAGALPDSTTLLVTGPGEVVYAGTVTPEQAAPALRVVPFDAAGPITAVAMDQSGSGYLVAQSVGRDGAPSSTIVALIAQD